MERKKKRNVGREIFWVLPMFKVEDEARKIYWESDNQLRTAEGEEIFYPSKFFWLVWSIRWP